MKTNWLAVALMLNSPLAFACGVEPINKDISNVKFNVNDTTFGKKQFEIHKTSFGWALADGDSQIYFDNNGTPCFAGGPTPGKCGEDLKNQIMDSKGVALRMTQTNLATNKQDTAGFAQFATGSVKKAMIWQKGDCEENSNHCIARDKPYLAITGSTFKDEDGNIVHTMNVQVMKIGSSDPLGQVQVNSTQSPNLDRCLSPVDNSAFLKGKPYTIPNLNSGKAYVINGAEVSEHPVSGVTAPGQGGTATVAN